jgi:hypothetical protein
LFNSARALALAQPRALAVLAGGLLVGALLRLRFAFTDDGIFWPDEVYQSLEPAHRLVFGYGLVAWEFVEGARNWAVPGFVALLLKLAVLFGLDRPEGYLGLVRVVFCGLSVATAWAVYRLGRALGAEPLPASVGAATFALSAVPLYFAHRAMSENLATLPVALGLSLVLPAGTPRRALVLGGALLGAAVLARLQCGVFAAGAVMVLLARRQWRPAADLLAVLAAAALVFGALDHFTWADAPGARWGGWFHSAVKYLEYNLVQGKAAGYGVSPWWFYPQRLFTSMPGLSVAFAAALVVCLRRSTALALLAVAFVGLHSAVAHKELRFVLPALPLLGAAVGVALSALAPVKWSWVLGPLVLVACLVSTVNVGQLTFGELGQYPDRPQASAWDDQGSVNRLMLAASKQQDLCGLRLDVTPLAWCGGHSYLHRRVPLSQKGQSSPQSRQFNYVITNAGSGAQVVANDGPFELVHLPVEPCVADEGYAWRLP